MHDLFQTFLNEEFSTESVSPAELDEYLAKGWRHFGTEFFRYNLGVYDDEIRLVIPLRIRLGCFAPSKSQARTLRKNSDLFYQFGPIRITDEVELLFERHKKRFKQHPPDSIHTFFSDQPALKPCDAFQLTVTERERLIATSFFDVGGASISGIYAVFDPDDSHRRLGIFTMLKEIEFAIAGGKNFYYQGYCYSGGSFYDYKKRFRGSEAFDWRGNWKGLEINI